MSNDIPITVHNATSDRDLFVTIFQKPAEANPNIIYSSLFPVAWQVLPLGPSQTADPVIYPVQLELKVTESEKFGNAQHRNTVQNVNFNEVWDFDVNKPPFSRVSRNANETGVDGVVVIRNQSNEWIDAGLSKNGSFLMKQPNIRAGEQADFQLTPKLYFLALSNIQKGDLIRSDQVTQNAYAVDLTGVGSVDVTVSTQDPTSGRLVWSSVTAPA
jgi:hypothetical protein